MGGSDVHDMSYYGKCMVGGILSCGLTHMLVCPLDIVKCRKQVWSFSRLNEPLFPICDLQVNYSLLESSFVNVARRHSKQKKKMRKALNEETRYC